jgi:hypothetical protein
MTAKKHQISRRIPKTKASMVCFDFLKKLKT